MLNSKTTPNKEVLGRMGITEENEKSRFLKKLKEYYALTKK